MNNTGLQQEVRHEGDLLKVSRMLAQALRLLEVHVRCTCKMTGGRHADTCHRMLSLKLQAKAECQGIHLDYDTSTGVLRERLAREVRRIVPVVLAVLTLVGPVRAQAPDTARIAGLEVIVDAKYPTSFFMEGYPQDGRAVVGEVYEFTAWPADPSRPPDQGPLPGHVTWSSDDESVLFQEIDDRKTLVVFTEPRDSVILKAALHPFHHRRPDV